MNTWVHSGMPKRAAECGRQAEAARDPELKLYLMKLALSWTQAAGDSVERRLEDVLTAPLPLPRPNQQPRPPRIGLGSPAEAAPCCARPGPVAQMPIAA